MDPGQIIEVFTNYEGGQTRDICMAWLYYTGYLWRCVAEYCTVLLRRITTPSGAD